MKRLLIIAAILLVATMMPSCSDSEQTKAKRLVEAETKPHEIMWIHQDSCYSITRPLMSVRYRASKCTRAQYDIANDEFQQLTRQLEDRANDHGGLKVKCYWIGYIYKYSTEVDSTLVMVEPTGELITDMQEREDWLNTAGELGKIANIIYSSY